MLMSRVTQQLLCSKSHDFPAVFALAHSKINQQFMGESFLFTFCFLAKVQKLAIIHC